MNQTTVDLKTISATELKALVYDLSMEVSRLQNNINFINNEINNRVKPAILNDGLKEPTNRIKESAK